MSQQPQNSADAISQVVSQVATRGISLNLSTHDLCFIVALHLRSSYAQLASFAEEQLEDVFAHVNHVVSDVAADEVREDIPERQFSRAIARLRQQNMLTRIDGLGVVRAPEYSLTRLAAAIVEYLLEDDILTRESLQVLTQSLTVTLGQIDTAAANAEDEDAWSQLVLAPLRITITELVRGIERRQRGLDQQQEAFQETIRGLLEADWFGAIGSCQELLETSSATLNELSELLLRGSQVLLGLLQSIWENALSAGHHEAATTTHRLIDQLDRIVAWGTARQSAWSEYFQYVHRFLRDVVRLDPSRALTQRLREQLGSRAGRSFALNIAAVEPMQLLREVVAQPDKPPVSRPKKPREHPPKTSVSEDPQAALQSRVQLSLDCGATTLVAVTDEIFAELPPKELFVHAGRIAQTVANVGAPRRATDRPWVRVAGDILIEDWALDGPKRPLRSNSSASKPTAHPKKAAHE